MSSDSVIHDSPGADAVSEAFRTHLLNILEGDEAFEGKLAVNNLDSAQTPNRDGKGYMDCVCVSIKDTGEGIPVPTLQEYPCISSSS